MPFAEDAGNGGPQVELGAKSVKHHSAIDNRDGRAVLLIWKAWVCSDGFIVESMTG